MNKIKFTSLAAGTMLALSFIISCSSDDGDGDKTVKIGSQIWMAENLNYDTTGSECYDNDPANCEKYGRLYNWETAKSVCPKGWHLPTRSEWEILAEYIGGQGTGAEKLKAKSGWDNDGNGTDEYGFAALPGGYYHSEGSFYDAGYQGLWWSASELGSDEAHIYSMTGDSPYASFGSADKSYLYSVRCIKDSP